IRATCCRVYVRLSPSPVRSTSALVCCAVRDEMHPLRSVTRRWSSGCERGRRVAGANADTFPRLPKPPPWPLRGALAPFLVATGAPGVDADWPVLVDPPAPPGAPDG